MAVILAPRDPRAYLLRGSVCAAQNRHMEAIADFDTCLQLDRALADAIREVVRAVVEELKRKLRAELERALTGRRDRFRRGRASLSKGSAQRNAAAPHKRPACALSNRFRQSQRS